MAYSSVAGMLCEWATPMGKPRTGAGVAWLGRRERMDIGTGERARALLTAEVNEKERSEVGEASVPDSAGVPVWA